MTGFDCDDDCLAAAPGAGFWPLGAAVSEVAAAVVSVPDDVVPWPAPAVDLLLLDDGVFGRGQDGEGFGLF